MSLKGGSRGYALGALGALALLLAASPSRADTPVSACGTLSSAGNYFLTTNLTSASTCIIVAHEGVSLDMKGHTITGNGTGDGITDGGVSFASMAIANGKIRNFDVGIGLDLSCCVVIRNVDSSNNADTGVLIGDCCSTLDSVKANNNGTVGIVASDCCYTLNNIQANNNGGGGGIVETGCCTTVANSTISGNGGAGSWRMDAAASWSPARWRTAVQTASIWTAAATSSSKALWRATWAPECISSATTISSRAARSTAMAATGFS